jgi:hypothetical protein
MQQRFAYAKYLSVPGANGAGNFYVYLRISIQKPKVYGVLSLVKTPLANPGASL